MVKICIKIIRKQQQCFRPKIEQGVYGLETDINRIKKLTTMIEKIAYKLVHSKCVENRFSKLLVKINGLSRKNWVGRSLGGKIQVLRGEKLPDFSSFDI